VVVVVVYIYPVLSVHDEPYLFSLQLRRRWRNQQSLVCQSLRSRVTAHGPVLAQLFRPV
jgi:hypothetical protein